MATSVNKKKKKKHDKMAYQKIGTQDPGLRTWGPHVGPGTRDPPPGTLHLGPGTFTWDPGPGTFHLGPFTWDPLCGTPGTKVRNPILFICL